MARFPALTESKLSSSLIVIRAARNSPVKNTIVQDGKLTTYIIRCHDKNHPASLPVAGNFVPIRGTMKNTLIEKYDRPAPRYTSYPTAPYWQDDAFDQSSWRAQLLRAYNTSPDSSVYVHLPFCEKLCTYCGCNKRITTNHDLEDPYITALLAEWALYLNALPGRLRLRELHLGGGTPTFFSPDNLYRFLSILLEGAAVASDFEGSFEAHPASTTREHLRLLYELGFRRISVGVQDFDNHILRTINRFQTREQIAQVTRWAREIGYSSVNYDLIFGLPFQTPEHIRANMEQINALRPDRIAFYSYAHVPWVKPSQRAYSEKDLPLGAEKRALYELGRDLLLDAGYEEIGMDHFALPEDSLAVAHRAGSLHRNFMGYTPSLTLLSIGLGTSAISDTWSGFAQNEKTVEAYQLRVACGEFPLIKGYELSPEDEIIRKHILNLMCRQYTSWEDSSSQCPALFEGLARLDEFMDDALIELGDHYLRITAAGKPFLRNISLAFDAHYWAAQPQQALFSRL